jgi:hypothetical protein
MWRLFVRGVIVAAFLVGVGLAPRAIAQTTGATCHLQDGTKAPAISVVVKEPAQAIRTGDAIAVEWRVEGDVNLACRTPLYLVLSTPNRTRFEGEKFLAFPPGAAGPYAIKHQLGRTRVFVPLHLGKSQASGTVLIKVYKDGPVVLDWALVEVPKLTADPKTAKDFAHGKERTGAVTRIGEGLSVISGNPTIVIRDHFPVEAPKKVIRSNSGEFDLQIFDKFYRVLDSKTGELLLERNSWDPNFSPSSRFLGAFADGPGFEIIDLYSGTVVTEQAELNRDRGYVGRVHLAAWSPGDTVFALSIWGHGGIEVQQALVDGSHRSFPDTKCHACQGIGTPLLLDLEAGIVEWVSGAPWAGAGGVGWESLIDRAVGVNASHARALKQIPEEVGDKTELWAKRMELTRQLAEQEHTRLASAAFFELATSDDSTTPEDPETKEPIAWRLGSQLKLSHHCNRDEKGLCLSNTSDKKLWRRTESRLAALRVLHSGRRSALLAVKQPLLAETRLALTRGGIERDAPSKGGTRGEASEQAWVWNRLWHLGLNVNDATTLKAPVRTIDSKEVEYRVIAPIVASIPSAAHRFPIGARDGLLYTGEEREATLIEPKFIQQLATFAIGERTYWLVQSHFAQGAGSRNFLALVHGKKTGPSTMVDLASRLKFRVGSRPSGLDIDGKLEMTDDWATTMGFGSWPSGVDKVTVAFERYLITSGYWTGDNLRWVLLFDLETDQILHFNRDVPAAATVDGFGVTEDGRTLVQLNFGGQLHFYDVATGNIILRGYHIDGELIVYDARGYYTASPEGSQFIFLKFPGLPGYNSLHQFARTLKRLDLIDAILAGKETPPDPRLTPPATLELAVDVTGSPAVRSARLRVAARSVVGLEKLRIFVDGAATAEHPLAGRGAAADIVLPLKPEARWVTVVAVDKAGYESVAQGAALPGATKAAGGRLFAISIGTDRYDDKDSIRPLIAAKIDASRFAETVRKLQGTTYGAVEVTPFLDALGLRSKLPDRLREVAAAAKASDTIMLFAAGHGFRDAEGHFYLATRETQLANLKETALAWDEIAKALDGTKARVIVLLDACKSGAADGGANDDAVSSLIKGKTSLTVLAAAKGRQASLELPEGGRFTTALIRAITTNRRSTDSNSNGAIELAELYGAVKREVMIATKGEQTPWIARNLMVGEIPLF